ncbi:hypothetical protein N7495_002256 [Penicillium taxi]|uniref:uncharacterized protein n=1 Tax=Penicillium taxi TaxID=168475 RepID=UPI002544DAD9|nr:uncharacterized protein N7495_002256 [Penicillium taxi]KAJ5901728.1 hypothetical protein N7495_002256 [Penicillium taxi]
MVLMGGYPVSFIYCLPSNENKPPANASKLPSNQLKLKIQTENNLPESPDQRTSLKDVKSAGQALKILKEAAHLGEQEFCVLTEVTSKLGNSLWNQLDSKYPAIHKTFLPVQGIFEIKRPGWAHQVILPWMFTNHGKWVKHLNLFTDADLEDLEIRASPIVDFTTGPYKGMRKELDLLFVSSRATSTAPGKSPLPSIMVEVGYSQSYTSLKENAERILIRGAPEIGIVIIIKSYTRKRGIASHAIFPVPTPPEPPLSFTREDILGKGIVMTGRPTTDVFPFDLKLLRRKIRSYL